MKQYETLEIVQEGPIRWISLNRPERRNAFNWQMHEDVAEAMQDAEEDDDTRVVVYKGNGPCFSAGHDLYEVAEDYLSGKFVQRPLHRRRIPTEDSVMREISKPVVSAIHGFVGPIGISSVMGSDLIIAAEGTVLSYEQMRVGGAGVIPLVAFIIGEKKTKEWQLLGRALPAEVLERHGLINKIVPQDCLIDQAREWATEIAAIPPQNVAANKAAINMVMNVLGNPTLRKVSHVYGSLGHGSGMDKEFFELALNKGLKTALAFRDEAHGGRESSGLNTKTS